MAFKLPTLADGSTVGAVAIFDSTGNQITSFGGSAKGTSATKPKISQNAASVLLLAANPNRKGFVIRNIPQAGEDLVISFVSPALLTDARLIADGGFLSNDDYTGAVYGIWSAAGTGIASIEEMV